MIELPVQAGSSIDPRPENRASYAFTPANVKQTVISHCL